MAAVTRLGLYGGPRGLYGSFAGKTEFVAAPDGGERLIIPPHPGLRVVDEQYLMEQHFIAWTQSVTKLEIVGGVGSPEGVVSAPQKTLYVDVGGATGSVLYVKRNTDISGDPTTGWILV